MSQILNKKTAISATSVHIQTASLPIRGLHWLMALILIAAWAFIYAKGIFEKGSDERELLKHLHVVAGLLVFILLPLRIMARWLSPLPDITPPLGRKQKLFTRTIHLAFYVCMIILPILGIIFMQMGGKTISIIGFELPTMIQTDKEFSRDIKKIHETLGLIMLYLAVIHAGIALWHHFFLHDNTLKLMLPNGTKARSAAIKVDSDNTLAKNNPVSRSKP
ncbi:hypothetical protein Nstercoris_02003 [Nitrosomonas stercoris]|uniref:Cytochrome b561 bacterial/Ni-hydrogenase domain-containing protein n=1 Tax=Nitrosomonas stercoris TaxID=1444684 RepID=A0A4Y1YPI1_9PROT|nr:hypothetical protein Nstercoris_02003 [Nitrosomonas stercoris]